LKHQTALPNRKLLIIRSYEYVGWGYMSDQTETSTEAIAMNLQKKKPELTMLFTVPA